MKHPKDNIGFEVMEAFTSMKSDQDIGMPNVEQELAKLKAKRNSQSVSAFRKIAASIAIVLAISGIAVAAIINHQAIYSLLTDNDSNTISETSTAIIPNELLITPSDTVVVKPGVVMFENAELDEIMTSISNNYKIEVVFKKEELKHLHLHYQYNTEDKLEQVLQTLNSFEKINVNNNKGKLEVQ